MLTTLNHQLVGCFSRDDMDLNLYTHTAYQHISEKGPKKRAVYYTELTGPHGSQVLHSGLINATQLDSK